MLHAHPLRRIVIRSLQIYSLFFFKKRGDIYIYITVIYIRNKTLSRRLCPVNRRTDKQANRHGKTKWKFSFSYAIQFRSAAETAEGPNGATLKPRRNVAALPITCLAARQWNKSAASRTVLICLCEPAAIDTASEMSPSLPAACATKSYRRFFLKICCCFQNCFPSIRTCGL
jgi:hypothetical protein